MQIYQVKCASFAVHDRVIIVSVPSAVLNLSEGTVSETSITVTWSRNPQSLQDKFQVSIIRIYKPD